MKIETVTRESAVTKALPSVPLPNKNKGKLLSLIIDDEVDICYLLQDLLQHKNIDNISVNNLADAARVLQSCDPAIIFLDNKLPDGLGIDHIRRFKDAHPKTKIVMLTAHDNFMEKALDEGADFFIAKPFSLKSIWDICDDLLV